MKKQVVITLDNNIYNHLQTVLKANSENVNTVMENLIKLYLKEYFEEAAKECETDIKLAKNNIGGKAARKLPRWAESKELNAHKIIRAFLLLEDIHKNVTLCMLKTACSDKTRDDIYVPKFNINFAQMKLDTEKSLGKVFIEKDGYVRISPDIHKHINKLKNSFTPELNVNESSYDFSALTVHELIKGPFIDILQSDKVTPDEIEWLCKKEATDFFNIDSIILVKADVTMPQNYYAKAIAAYGKEYYLAANWTKRSRKQLIEWIEKHI